MKNDSPPYIVGIKLGNTNAVLSCVDTTGRINVIFHSKREKEKSAIPCLFHLNNGSIAVGYEALQHTLGKPEQVIGLKLSHIGGAAPKTTPTEYTQELLLEKLFAQIIIDGVTSLGFIDDVVLSVPDYLDSNQRKVLGHIAERFGLIVKRIIDHSESILYGYGYPDFPKETTVALVRLGGTSLTVKIVKITGEQIEVLSDRSDFTLGSDRWDEIVMHALADKFKKVYTIEVREDPQGRKALTKAIRQAKVLAEARGILTTNFMYGEKQLQVDLTRDEIHSITKGFCDNLKDALHRTVKEAHLAWDSIEQVLIGGGGARTPGIIDTIDKLSQTHIAVAERPEEVITRGASSNGYYLKYGRIAQYIPRERSIESPPTKTVIADQPEGTQDKAWALTLLVKGKVSKKVQFENEEEISIGRGKDNMISFHQTDYHMISRRHAIIEYRSGFYYLIDKSTNGTFINGVKLVKWQEKQLKEGDVMMLAPKGPLLKVLSII